MTWKIRKIMIQTKKNKKNSRIVYVKKVKRYIENENKFKNFLHNGKSAVGWYEEFRAPIA